MNIQKAINVLPFVGVLERDQHGRPVLIGVPAYNRFPDGKRGPMRTARVRIDRQPGAVLTCRVYDDSNGPGESCKAAEGRMPCYHCLAALYAATTEAGYTCHPTTSHAEAVKAKRPGGQVWRVWVNGAEVWAALNLTGKAARLAEHAENISTATEEARDSWHDTADACVNFSAPDTTSTAPDVPATVAPLPVTAPPFVTDAIVRKRVRKRYEHKAS